MTRLTIMTRFTALLTAALLLAAPPLRAQAQCARMNDFTRDETRQLMSLLVAPEADPLDQLFAFEDLMCSVSPVVRNMALKAGATSGSADVRSQILFRALSQQQIIRVELGEGRAGDGTAGEYSNRILNMPVEAVNDVAGCISFQPPGKATCNQTHHLMLMGPGIRVFNRMKMDSSRWYTLNGDMTYSFGDTIDGELSLKGAVYPATIRLF